MNRVSIPIFALLVFLSATCITANAVKQDTQQPAPDNTKTNKSASPTADQQKMNASDRDVTKKIRMAIHDDKSMSTYAHNVKIITQNGKVTLKGPVHSEEEKTNIAAKATSIAGDGNVDNQIDVVPAKQ
jgi:hyperosmotically inducible protein